MTNKEFSNKIHPLLWIEDTLKKEDNGIVAFERGEITIEERKNLIEEMKWTNTRNKIIFELYKKIPKNDNIITKDFLYNVLDGVVGKMRIAKKHKIKVDSFLSEIVGIAGY